MTPISATRDWFDRATTGILDTVGRVSPGDLDQPGLGDWSVRDLMGHASRSYLTIETYLHQQPGADAVRLTDAADYYRAAMATVTPDNADEITERGRAAGRALGDQPPAAFAELAHRVRTLVAATEDEAAVVTPFGVMTLGTYLPTRAFELTVHGLDLAAAIGISPPGPLAGTAPDALAVCARLATPEAAVTAVLALTGRGPLPDGFSVL